MCENSLAFQNKTSRSKYLTCPSPAHKLSCLLHRTTHLLPLAQCWSHSWFQVLLPQYIGIESCTALFYGVIVFVLAGERHVKYDRDAKVQFYRHWPIYTYIFSHHRKTQCVHLCYTEIEACCTSTKCWYNTMCTWDKFNYKPLTFPHIVLILHRKVAHLTTRGHFYVPAVLHTPQFENHWSLSTYTRKWSTTKRQKVAVCVLCMLSILCKAFALALRQWTKSWPSCVWAQEKQTVKEREIIEERKDKNSVPPYHLFWSA